LVKQWQPAFIVAEDLRNYQLLRALRDRLFFRLRKDMVMKASTFQLCSAIFVMAAMLFLHSAAALADTYQIFDLGGPRQIYGIDSTSDIVIFDTGSSCDVHDNPCYDLFHQGTVISFSDTAPMLNYDDGTPCTPALPPGFVVSVAVCNGGREAFGETSPLVGLFTGSTPLPTSCMMAL
jgi:hypothetical protein